MSTESLKPKLVGMIRRQWWLVAIAFVVAGVVGFAASSGSETLYVGKAVIVVDPATVSKGVGIPEAELLLKDLQSDAFREKASATVGATAAEIETDARIYTTGTPQDRLVIEFSSPDETRAGAVAVALADAIVAEAKVLSAVELEKQTAIVTETRKTVRELEAFTGGDGWEQSDVAFKLWSVKKDLVSAEALLTLDENAYTYDGRFSVAISGAADQRRMATTAAAAFIGLLVGLGLGMIRERRDTRAARA